MTQVTTIRQSGGFYRKSLSLGIGILLLASPVSALADGRAVLDQFFDLNRFGDENATLTVDNANITESSDHYIYRDVKFGYFDQIEVKFAEIKISKDASFGDTDTINESILSGVTFESGAVAVAIEEIATTGFSHTDSGATVPDTDNIYADFAFNMLAAITGTSFELQKITGLTYAFKLDGSNVDSSAQATIPSVVMESMTNGRIGLLELRDMQTSQQQAAPELQQITLTQSIDRAYITDYNLTALAAWAGLMPDQAAGEWLTLAGKSGYDNYAISEPELGINFSIREVAASGYKVLTGQWQVDQVVELIEEAEGMVGDSAPSPEVFAMIDTVYQSLDFGSIELNDMNMTGPDGMAGQLRQIEFGPDLSGVGSSIGVHGLSFDMPNLAKVAFDNFSLGGLRYPNLTKLGKMIEAEEAGVGYNPLDFLEQFLSSVSMANLSVDVLGMQSSLKLFDYKMDKFVGPIPTETKFILDHLVVPVELINDPMIAGQLQALGFTQLDVSAASEVRFDEPSGTLHIDDVQLRMEDGGHLFFSGELSGLPLLEIRSEADVEQLMATMVINEAKVRFENLGGVDRGFDFAAQMQGVDGTVFRQQIAGAVPFFLGSIGNPDFQAKAAPTIQAFLDNPGSLSVLALPTDPVAVLQIMALAESNPGKIIDLLGLAVEANN